MRVLVNQLTALRHKAGIGHYTEQLMQELESSGEPVEIVRFPSGMTEWALKKLQQQRRRGAAAGGGTTRWRRAAAGMGRHLAEWNFRLFAALGRGEIYHEPNILPFPCGLPTIATLHDMSLLQHPEWHPAERVRNFEKHVPRLLTQCRHFIAISEFSRQQAMDCLGVSKDRVTSVPLAFRRHLLDEPTPEGRAHFHSLGLPPSYLLHVGTLEPRKNLLMLMKAYCALPSNVREKCPLVLAGGWGWNTQEIACYYQEEARHKNVVHLGYVPEEAMGSLYRGARVLLFPSHYEGFGLPAIEMLALGGAVLCSTAGALREVVGERGFFLDPSDEAGWHGALRRLCVDEEWASTLRPQSTSSYREMTWHRCALGTYAVYRYVLGESASPELLMPAA